MGGRIRNKWITKRDYDRPVRICLATPLKVSPGTIMVPGVVHAAMTVAWIFLFLPISCII